MTLPKGGKRSGGPAAPRAVPLSLPGASEDVVAPFEGSSQFLQLGSGARGKVAAAPDLDTVLRSAPSDLSSPGKPRIAGPSHGAAPRTSLQNFMPERQDARAAAAAAGPAAEQGAGKKGCVVQ